MKQKEVKKDEKSNRKRNIIFAVIIVFLMVTSVFGILVYNQDSNEAKTDTTNLEYNGYVIYNVNNKWAVLYGSQYIYFDFNPKQLEDVSIGADVSIPFSGDKVYIAQDYSKDRSNQDFSVRQIGSILTLIGSKVVFACNSDKDCPDIPLVDCNSGKDVIDIRSSNTSVSNLRIYKQGGCTVFEGDSNQISKEINKYGYFVIGVVNK